MKPFEFDSNYHEDPEYYADEPFKEFLTNKELTPPDSASDSGTGE